MNPQQPTQIDQDVKNLVSAMGRAETGTSSPEAYKKRGASGEFGRYQFMPDTWKQWSSEYGIQTPLEQASIEEQNKVAYNKVKEWKDQGLNPAQIASKWNSGDADAYKRNHTGTNAQGVAYNTPEHVRRVSQYYNEIKGGGQLGGNYLPPPPTKDFTPAQESGVQTLAGQVGVGGGFVGDLGQAFSRAGTRGSEAMQRGFSGESDPFSAVYQTAGAGAGAIGDVVDASLSNLPLGIGKAYQGATDLIGGAVQGAMETAPGQKITETVEGFSPDTQRNIGATLDLISVIPFFKALKLSKRGVTDAVTGLTASKVTQQAADEIESTLSKGTSRNLDRSRSRGLDPVKVILDEPSLIPDIIEQNGRYIYYTKQGAQSLQRSIDADEQALQNLLNSTIKQNVGVNINDVRNQVINDLLPKGKINVNRSAVAQQINRVFDDIAESAGRNYISLSDLNEVKRQIRNGLNFDAIDPTRALTRQVQFDAGQSVMKQVEKIAEKAGAKGVRDINRSMGQKLSALDILEDLDGKAIKSGSKGKDGLIKSVGRTIPGVEGIIDYASRGVPLTPTRRLKDRRPLRETGRRGLVQLGAGLGLSGQLTEE
jgi:hypothetical protein